MKALLTGATGLVGAAVQHYLQSHDVAVITAGRAPENEVFFDPHSEARSRAESWPRCDATIHIAAANEIGCRENPSGALITNVFGTQLALDQSRIAGIPSFVYVSTFHVYGNTTGLIDEDIRPEPIDAYGLTHLFAEETVTAFSRQHGTQTTTLRPSNLFGMPPSIHDFHRWSLVPYGFCRDAVKTGQIVLRTPGLQQRNFVHLDVLSEQILRSARHGSSGATMNVAGADTLTIKHFAQLVCQRAKVVLGLDVELIAPSTPPSTNPPALIFGSTLRSVSADPALALTTFIDQLLFALKPGAR